MSTDKLAAERAAFEKAFMSYYTNGAHLLERFDTGRYTSHEARAAWSIATTFRAALEAKPAPADPCLVLWKAMNEAEKVGNRSDDKLIVEFLRRAGYVIAAAPAAPEPMFDKAVELVQALGYCWTGIGWLKGDAPAAPAKPVADALRLADAIDPFTRSKAPDHLTSKVAADTLRALAAPAAPAEPVVVGHHEFVAARGQWRAIIWTDTPLPTGTKLHAAPAALAPAEPVSVSKQQALEALDSMDDFARMAVGVDAHGPRDLLERFITAAPAAPAGKAQPLNIDIDRGRVWIKRGNQSFMMAYEGDEDELQWYCDRLKEALSGITPDVKTAPAAPAPVPAEPHLFEFWWGRYMPHATQAEAWEAWTAAPRTDGVGVAAPAAPAPHSDERADLAERIEAAHEASLDGDHRACCAILTECLKMLAFPKVAPMTGPKVAFWVYEWLHPTDGSVTLRSLRPEDHCRKPDRAIPVPLMDEWVQWAKAAAPAEVPELVALLRLVEEIAGANSAQVAPVYSELAGNALADYRAAISASKGGA